MRASLSRLLSPFNMILWVFLWGFPGGSVVKNLSANTGNTGDVGVIPGSGRSPGEGNGSPLQYSCLENPMDRGAWCSAVHGVTESWTRLNIHACCLPYLVMLAFCYGEVVFLYLHLFTCLFTYLLFYLFVWLVLVAARGIFVMSLVIFHWGNGLSSCGSWTCLLHGMWD